MLLLSAARAAVQEEFVVLGYLFARLRQLGWGPWAIVLATSVLRASYHLYQGPGAFVGNLAMGLLFGLLFLRTGRLLPFLEVAHFMIDGRVHRLPRRRRALARPVRPPVALTRAYRTRRDPGVSG